MLKRIFARMLLGVFAFGIIALSWPTVALGDGCFSIVVGKDASVDGYVIMAHNEDDAPPQIVNHRKVSRMQHPPHETVELLAGGELDQVEVTWAYIWSEMPGMLFSDSYINEWGVCIASDACPSREDQPELTDGGISYMLRRLVAERAKTAREGVTLAVELVDRFGYDAFGRTYIICDPDEGWFFCAVGGKHWLSRRIPDNEVAVVANSFTVHEVDLSDQTNFLTSEDIVDYAISRSWYDPESGSPFDFAAVYADPEVASDSSNYCRQWSGLRHVAGDSVPLSESLPFSVVPKNKLDAAAVVKILRDDYEGTELYQTSPETGSPDKTGLNTICNWTTQTSFVAQLRRGMPLDIGIVYWMCLSPPCASFYIPFHFGISTFPTGFASSGEQPSDDFYKEKVEAPFRADPSEAFWTFSNFYHKIASDYGNKIASVRVEVDGIEQRAFALHKPVEEVALELYSVDKAAAADTLANYSNGIYLSTLEAMARILGAK
jgi:dipeptidase